MSDGTAAARAREPLSMVEMDLKTYVKFLVDGLATEQIQPMRDQLTGLTKAVMGNGVPPLSQQIATLSARISTVELTIAKPSSSTMTLARLSGAFEALWKLGVVILAVLEGYHYIHGGKWQ